MSEQIKIIEYILDYEANIEVLKRQYQKEIGLLKEYKTALISEVVTGKVDVRTEKLN